MFIDDRKSEECIDNEKLLANKVWCVVHKRKKQKRRKRKRDRNKEEEGERRRGRCKYKGALYHTYSSEKSKKQKNY